MIIGLRIGVIDLEVDGLGIGVIDLEVDGLFDESLSGPNNKNKEINKFYRLLKYIKENGLLFDILIGK